MKVSYALGAGLVLLLTWLLLRGMNPDARQTEAAIHALDRLAIAQSALQRDILRARSGVLRNYDPLVSELDMLRRTAAALTRDAWDDEAIAAAVNALAAAISEQEELAERFKTSNAILQNSLTRLATVSTWPKADGEATQQLAPLVGNLSVALLNLTLDATPAAAREVALLLDHLEYYSSDDTFAGLITQARTLQRALPEMDAMLKALASVPVEARRDALRRAVVERSRLAEARAQRYRYVLYSLSLLLLGGFLAFAIGLRRRAQTLRRRATLENLIASISTRLVNAAYHKIDEEIEAALPQLASQIGADRAYLVTQCVPPRVYSWCRDGAGFPDAWPFGARAAAEDLNWGGNGFVHVCDAGSLPAGRARDILGAAGVGGWACVSAIENKSCGLLLGFDALAPHRLTAADELSLLRVVLDAMADGTHRQILETERARLERTLQEARRMETVGAIASGVAHNFNNIIGAIQGYAEMAQGEAPAGRLAANIEGIRTAAQRAQDLVEKILAFGRRREPRCEPVVLGTLLDESRSLLAAALPARIKLSIRQEHGDAMLCGEAGQLQQVILNLCTNAAQAMDDNGRIAIAITTSDAPDGVQLSHGTLPPGRYCVIAVEDHGRGMSDATAKRIFEPFFTTRDVGNGLGLATVREIVSDHGGAIHLRTAPGAGTRFEVWLPCGQWTPAPADDALRPMPALGQGETVLIIAGSRTHLLRHEEAVAALGYEPVGFVSADEALAACAEAPGRFDAALVRWMPSAAGLDVAARLHRAAPRLPILLAVASSDDHDADALMNAGVFDLIHQPTTPAELAGVLACCIRPQRADALQRKRNRPVSETVL